MGWGGARPGSGPKKKANPNRPRQVAEPKVRPAETKLAPAEPKTDLVAGPAIDPRAWAMMLPEIEEISKRYAINKARTAENNPFKLPDFPKHAIPPASLGTMAMDSALTSNLDFSSSAWLAGDIINGLTGEGMLFLGYTYLSELAQRPEYRVMSETIADDATRKWIDFDVVGDEKIVQEQKKKDPAGFDERMADPDDRKKRLESAGKTDRVKELQDDQLRLEVKDRYYEQCRNGGFFGRTHLFHDIRTTDTDDIQPEELKSSIGDSRDATSRTKVPKGSFKGLRTIEPVWTYPLMYNAINPIRKDWYNPQVWFVMGQEIHGTRLQTFIPHPVPDMLKPAYAFGGLSLSQMSKPYVDRWLTTVTSVNQLIHSFSVMVLMTDLSTLMQPGNVGALLARVAMFNMLRDNQGTFVVNKNTEDFKNVSAQLAGLHELQAQAQEHMASINRIPLVKFTGIQPSGLNACLPGDVLILTDRGQVPISDVMLSDRVMTRGGFAPLTFSGITKYATELIEIKTARASLKCTANHPIWLPSINAFVRAENVRHGDLLLLIGEKNDTPNMRRPWHGAGNGGGETRSATSSPGMPSLSERFISIGEFGKHIAGLFRMASTSTTWTAIRKIIRSPTLNQCTGSFMPSITVLNLASAGDVPPLNPHLARTAGAILKNSRIVRSFAGPRASPPTDEQIAHLKQGLGRSALASCAGRLSMLFAKTRSFVRGNVQRPVGLAPNIITPIISRTLKNSSRINEMSDALRLAMSQKNASDAELSLCRPDDAPNCIAPNDVRIAQGCHDSGRIVSVRRIRASEPVYDLTVARGHLPEFFANGILTHNSSEGEIEVYDDTIGAYQSRVLDANLRRTINFQQLSLWGEIDPEITHRWEPLRPMTQAEKGQKEKDDADRNQKYVDMGAVSPEEIRKIIINDKELPYTGLNPDDVPDLLTEENEGLEPVGGRPQPGPEGAEGSEGGPAPKKPGGEGGEA